MPVITRLTQKYKQDPADVLDYGWNWQGPPQPFLVTGETISTSTWAAYDTSWAPTSDVVLSSPGHDSTTTTTWLTASGPTILGSYFVANTIVTNQGRTKEQSFQITFEEE
jgi:hypothetical protein